ncbi:cyclophilin-like fold protein [Xylocopilactobacillus apis]|uniref:Cyclophilin-like domain-containing protein n=1 Tax=Xylocopilactobacillus apis TaxID=2932183 RepID=A0AAU9D0Y2_9LACO|nr:cyclophilin-like fold protein [Xylocopilactobacillus apis]BDR57339.1 hypothetical protein KIMC2_19010 [Xylocopilactobacillus apis]
MKKTIITFFTTILVLLASVPVSQSVNAAAESKEQSTPIVVIIEGHHYHAVLNDSVPAKQLAKRLPLTLKFSAMAQGIDEKISDLEKPLSTNGTPVGADPNPGDIAYWSPQPRLVLYWGDVGYYPGIHLLGKFTETDRAEAIKALRDQNTDFNVQILKDNPSSPVNTVTPLRGEAKIVYKKGYGVNLWKSASTTGGFYPGRKLKHGTRWKVSGKQNGFYRVGKNQWIQGAYASYKSY